MGGLYKDVKHHAYGGTAHRRAIEGTNVAGFLHLTGEIIWPSMTYGVCFFQYWLEHPRRP